MSGTSLDGVDVALCQFSENVKGTWSYKVKNAHTYPYNSLWEDKLKNVHLGNAMHLAQINVDYANYLSSIVLDFKKNYDCNPALLASHGHTVFHNPSSGLSCQIGSGAVLSALTGMTVVSDFRSQDVAHKGQGAPLVPIGDDLLFNEYNFCINLGGFANVSYNQNNIRVAFDICPVNIMLNSLYQDLAKHQKNNLNYDENGATAASGVLCSTLLEELNNIEFYKASYPKSLSREWLEKEIVPLIQRSDKSIPDKLHTFNIHVAMQISKVLGVSEFGKVLLTGGGTFNKFLVSQLIKMNPDKEIIVPTSDIINFKEAIIFAFLGLLRFRGETNCLKSVTGALRNSCSGALYTYL